MFFRPALLADQRHETDFLDLLLVPGFGAGARQPDQALMRRRVADRHHQPTVDGELGAPGIGHARTAGSGDDGVERRLLGPAQRTVAGAHLDIVVAELAQTRAGEIGECGMAFDGEDAIGQLAQHGGGVTRARADLEHAITRTDVGGLGHARHDVGLRHGLAFLDRQRRVLVGELLQGVRQERLARHLLHRRQHTAIGDAAARDLAADHASARIDDSGHDRQTTHADASCRNL